MILPYSIFYFVGYCFIYTSAKPQSLNLNNDDLSGGYSDKFEIAKITKFHVNTNIQMRYAVTEVETQIKNQNMDAEEVFFDMYIPEEAFVSNFSLSIKDKVYVAKVETKEKAKEIYSESNDTAGLLQSNTKSEFEGTQHVTFSAKLEPYEKVTFNLKYEELLDRSNNGIYEYKLNLHPKNQVVKDFKIKVNINETLPLKDLKVKEINDVVNEISSKAKEINSANIIFDEKKSPNQANIEYIPSKDEQKNGQDWQFILNYDVNRPEDGNDIQIGAGKFVHYYSPPDELETMTKHVIFVIDVSGSMAGRKLIQTIDAMTTILSNLNPDDSFDILTFSSDVSRWVPQSVQNDNTSIINDTLKEERFTANELLDESLEFVLNLNAGGGTNINDALLKAITIAHNVSNNDNFSDVKQQMIIFLTDGIANTDSESIKTNVKKANSELKIPIYGLAFGDGADFNLIKDLATESQAFSKRIYESGNSFEQLENFYNEISDPKLRDVNFQYLVNGKIIQPEFLTRKFFKNAYGKKEYVIVGEIEDNQIDNFEIKIDGQDANGDYASDLKMFPCPVFRDIEQKSDLFPHRCIPIRPIPSPVWQKSPTEAFMERLWAFKRIKYLLNQNKCDNINETLPIDTEDILEEKEPQESPCNDNILQLAKKYNFVTKITSLVVESNDEYIRNGSIIPNQLNLNNNEYIPKSSFYSFYAASYAAPAPSPQIQSFATSYAAPAPSPQIQSYAAPPPPPRQKLNRKRPQIKGANPSGYKPRPPPIKVEAIESEYDSILEKEVTTSAPCTSGKLTLYSKTYFRGESIEIKEDVSSFLNLNFDDRIGSVNVEGNCCWKIYVDEEYNGVFMELSPKEYQSATDIKSIFKKASSAEMFSCYDVIF